MADKILTVDEVLKNLNLHKGIHTELHVHHTWKPNHSNFNGKNGLELQAGMRNFHVGTNGWDDIAQHFTLLPDGTFVTGRSLTSPPASIKGYNGRAGALPVCIEMLGDFDEGKDKLVGKQLESIIKVAKFFDSQSKYIRFHNENSGKTCPGSGIGKNWFMAKVREPQPLPKKVEPVSDIAGHWAYDAIVKVIASKQMVGYTDGTFRPDAPITRAELATLIANGKI